MEGPSLLILREECRKFSRKKILNAYGNTKTIDLSLLKGKTVIEFDSWGKHFLIVFKKYFIRIHFLMFGSYRIDEEKESIPRLALVFTNGIFFFYSCSVQQFDGSPDDYYDRQTDVLSTEWNPAKALKSISSKPDEKICDLILDQQIFSGAGNIIKNEVLFRLHQHPDSLLRNLSIPQRKQLVSEVEKYCTDFYNWKKVFELRKHWIVYKQRKCKSCGSPIISVVTGKLKRRTYYCPEEQKISD